MQAVDGQSWDNSVKGLTQFPDVLQQMAGSLSWTSSLGDAYFKTFKRPARFFPDEMQPRLWRGYLESTPTSTTTYRGRYVDTLSNLDIIVKCD